MKHRKHQHSEHVPTCKNIINGDCVYGFSCWFRHSETENEMEIGNGNFGSKDENIAEKLFEMMGKFAQRLSQMESEFRTKQ